MPRATHEEMMAAVAAQEGKAPPKDILTVYKAIIAAAHTGQLGLSSFIPEGGTRVYHALMLVATSGEMTPIAVLPTGMTVGRFIKFYDEWLDILGCAESDPEFTGSKQ